MLGSISVRAFLLAATVVTVACGDDEVTTLEQQTYKELFVHVPSTLSDEPRHSVSLQIAAVGENPGRCPVFDEDTLQATLGGSPLGFGGIVYDPPPNISGGYSYCIIGFGAPAIMPSSGVVTVSDRTQAVSATFEQGALEVRTASHTDWTFARGETVTLLWSRPTDLVGSDTYAAVDFTAQAPQISVSIVPPDGITFTVPVDHPVGEFEALVEVYSRPFQYDFALDCVNALSCRADQNRRYVHNATIY